ncbi:MAG: SpoIID/LytB domain-containing protein [Microcoleus sp. SIO2G3]|nr:SpoIID/LytB domain-containing protein [Microcoleus sp. SIO2G3]
MFRSPDKHPVFNRSVLWTTFLFSAALVVPIVLAKSLAQRPQPSLASPQQPFPDLASSPEPSQADVLAERDWHQRLVSQSLSLSPSNTTTSTSTSKSAVAKTDKPSSKSSPKKTSTSQPQKSTAKSQDSKPSQTSKKQQRKSQGSTTAEAQAAQAAKNAPLLELRVAVANGDSTLVVGTSTAGEVLDARGKVLGKLPANDGTNVIPEGANIRIGNWQTPGGVWLKPTKGGYVFVGDRWYRGDLLLVSQGNTLLAVNYVDLENYLVSVVGAEVSPSWPMAALKAQAIAARSYALVHYLRPANALYDLGNTQRWQVYKGISAEWNTTQQAVQETTGVFLSHKGGVVESMYAASDEIVTNVFGGRGMSQTGALKLAQQGYDYQQILGTYYPGVGLSWIDTRDSDVD